MGSQQVADVSAAVPSAVPSAAVAVEAIALRVTPDGGLAHRAVTGPLDAGRHPDAVARDLLGLPAGGTAHLLHSTSWRHEPGGRVVLTYACCPDPHPALPAAPLPDRVPIARGDGPSSPSPAAPRPAQIAAHAARHLAFLCRTDTDAAAVIASVPGLARALDRWSPAPAGQLPAH
ncbi:hypothetical protein [Actinomadura algeriensis]|uniref:Uncharacterized protein n=1 Tax=Actinomadura algeriensis TaxID=1679523 RepID=A0ABR9JJE7_9ACTN|nr:hypothetical protein [Actinomadura algeriensis]MBE1530672.1 hypothetical protein [Actinomadura algeriensis]